MATGSTAAARARLAAAGYRTGRAQYEMRCDGCAHHQPLERGTRYDRYCSHHRAGVKTHGHCNDWERSA